MLCGARVCVCVARRTQFAGSIYDERRQRLAVVGAEMEADTNRKRKAGRTTSIGGEGGQAESPLAVQELRDCALVVR